MKKFDLIEGFENFEQYGKTNKTAKCVLVFIVGGFSFFFLFILLLNYYFLSITNSIIILLFYIKIISTMICIYIYINGSYLQLKEIMIQGGDSPVTPS